MSEEEAASETLGHRTTRAIRWLGSFINLPRLVAAALLLSGLFGLLFFVLLPGGDDDDAIRGASLIETPMSGPGPDPGIEPGRLARDFEASDLDGRRLRLSDLRGRPLVINFWATWCTSCLSEMPDLEEQRQAHAQDGLAVVAVNVGERAGRAREFIDALDLVDFAIALDSDLTVADAYGVRGMPHSVFVDRSGVIQAVYRGPLDAETMERYLRAAIEAVQASDEAPRLRFVTTVPREHVLEVLPGDGGRVLFRSRRFRCDDTYCARAAIASGLRSAAGVRSFEWGTDPNSPELFVSFDPTDASLDAIVNAVAGTVREVPDPLYTRELEVQYPGGRS